MMITDFATFVFLMLMISHIPVHVGMPIRLSIHTFERLLL